MSKRAFESPYLEESYAIVEEIFDLAKYFYLRSEKKRLSASSYDTYHDRIKTMIGWIWKYFFQSPEGREHFAKHYEKGNLAIHEEKILPWNWSPIFTRCYFDNLTDRYGEDDISSDYINSFVHALHAFKTFYTDLYYAGVNLNYSYKHKKREYKSVIQPIPKDSLQLGGSKEEYLELMADRDVLRDDKFSTTMKIDAETGLEMIALIRKYETYIKASGKDKGKRMKRYDVDYLNGELNDLTADLLEFALFSGSRLQAALKIRKKDIIWLDPNKYTKAELDGYTNVKKKKGGTEKKYNMKNKIRKLIKSNIDSPLGKVQCVIFFESDKGGISGSFAIFEDMKIGGKSFEEVFYERWKNLKSVNSLMFPVVRNGQKPNLEQSMSYIEQVVYHANKLYLSDKDVQKRLGLFEDKDGLKQLVEVNFQQPQYKKDENGEFIYREVFKPDRNEYGSETNGSYVKEKILETIIDPITKKEKIKYETKTQQKWVEMAIRFHSFRKGNLDTLYKAARGLTRDEILRLVDIHKKIQITRGVKEINKKIGAQKQRLNQSVIERNIKREEEGKELIGTIPFTRFQWLDIWLSLTARHSRIGLIFLNYVSAYDIDIEENKRDRIEERRKERLRREKKKSV